MCVLQVWGSAQDQARVLRSQLQAMVPGLRVWLGTPPRPLLLAPHSPPLRISSRAVRGTPDVEDLEDISALERYIDSAQAILVIVSLGYFQSRSAPLADPLACIASNYTPTGARPREQIACASWCNACAQASR